MIRIPSIATSTSRFSAVLREVWIGLIVVLALLGLATSVEAAWCDSNWQFSKKLTIDYTKVEAILTNFPVIVSLSSDTDLAADAQDDNDDILLTSSNGTTKLDHEIEYFNGTTAQLVAWVKIPSLSKAVFIDTDAVVGAGSGAGAGSGGGGGAGCFIDTVSQSMSKRGLRLVFLFTAGLALCSRHQAQDSRRKANRLGTND